MTRKPMPIARIALALVIVMSAGLSGLGGPVAPVGTAAAEWSEECSFSSSLLGAAYNTIVGTNSGCRWISGDSTDWDNLTASQGYGNGLALGDSVNSYVTQTSNFMQDSRTVVSSKAKITTVNELNNESSMVVAQDRVNETIREYYSQVQANIIRDYNSRLVHLKHISKSGVKFDIQYAANGDTVEYSGLTLGGNKTYTLSNGSVVDVRAVKPESTVSGQAPVGADHARISVKDTDTTATRLVLDMSDYAGAPDANYNEFNGERMLYQTEQQEQWAIDNFDHYVRGVYNQYAAGELNGTTLALNDPTVLAAEASTSFNSTGYYSYAAIQLAAIGATGDMNVSHSIDVYANATDAAPTTSWNGTLMYTGEDAPAGWNTSDRYSLSDYNGTFFFVVSPADANKSAYVVDLSQHGEEFVLSSATNTRTGENVTTTSTHQYVYATADASQLAEEIDRLQDLREQYENQNSGGSGFGFGGNGNMLILGVVIALLAVILLQK